VSRRILLACLAALVGVSGCRSTVEPSASGSFQRAPILLIGVDGFEWNIALPLLHQGRMPALAGLLRRGSYGLLETFPGRVSPALWTSVATGKVIEKHGIESFLRQEKPPVFFTSRDRRTKAFWNILSEQGRRVDMVGWFVTYPVEPILGTMVAQSNTQAHFDRTQVWKGALLPGVEGQVFPREREAEIFTIMTEVELGLDEMLDAHLQTGPADIPPSFKAIVEASRWSFRADTIYQRTAKALARSGTPDLLAVYLGSTDVVSHRFWPHALPRGFPERTLNGRVGRRLARHMPPGSLLDQLLGGTLWAALAPAEAEGWPAQVILRTYEGTDRAIGELVAAMPTETTVMVVSDHGFRPWGHGDGPDALFLAAGTNVRRSDGPAPEDLARSDLRRLGSILDITPTLLALSGIPLGLDMDGHVLDAVLAPLAGTVRSAPVTSHDSKEWLVAHSGQAPRPDATGDTQTERLEQLRALGYIK
jgi:hypothetical protein